MRCAALLLAVFTTLLATWPWSVMPSDVCSLFADEPACTAGSCCARQADQHRQTKPCAPEQRPCCDPFMACSGCACPMPTSPLAMGALPALREQRFAMHAVTLLEADLEEAWHPPNVRYVVA